MGSRGRDEHTGHQAPHVPWHNRTSTVLGASVAGLTAIAIVVTSINYVARQFNEPERAPLNYVGPSSATVNRSSTLTTTGTITSTKAPITRDINPEPAPSITSSSPTSTRNPNYRPPRTREADGSPAQTTRSRPRKSVTPTLNPAR